GVPKVVEEVDSKYWRDRCCRDTYDASLLSFIDKITGFVKILAQQEVRSSWLCVKRSHFDRLLVLYSTPLDTAFAFAFAFTLGQVNHVLRSLPHLPNIVSALSKRWQVGVEELPGPAISR
ncbi:Hypothetical predicted protein, partial [Scomber scombrus]